MMPLNVYLESATPEQLERAVHEYGNAIRELAIANVFPGDMLWRNFGVTRHGRVVFYDYDEIEYLTDCVFRAIPPAPNPEAELAERGLVSRRAARRVPRGVRVLPARRAARARGLPRAPRGPARARVLAGRQRQVARGEVVDFFPYPESARFCERFGDGAVVDLRAAGHL